MRLADLLRHLDVRTVRGPVDRPVAEVRHDSREVGPEDVFVAVRGARVDARRFAPALRCAAVVADAPVEVAPGTTAVLVDDARAALAVLAAARHGFPGRDVPVVGVTGTNGKTTVTWMLEAIARAAGGEAAVLGTTGHRVAGRPLPAPRTTPEAPVVQRALAAARDAGCLLAAVEASSIGLALRRLDAVPFRVAALTVLGRDHLDFHGDMAAYEAAKRRLFDELLAPDGLALVPEDLAHRFRPAGRETWTWGRGPAADVAVLEERPRPGGTVARLATPAGEVEVDVPLPGAHNLSNALVAAGAAVRLGLPLEAVAAGLAALPTVPGRLERVSGPGPAVYVDYAHTPDALRAALSALRPGLRGRLWVVFGCGGERDRGKRPLMGAVAAELADRVVLTSDNPRGEDPAAIIEEVRAGIPAGSALLVEPDRGRAIARAIAEAAPEDVVLVAGKGHEAFQEIGDRRTPFDDRAHARRALAARAGGGVR